MEGHGFDPNQFAYFSNRSSTQAVMVIAEQIKRGLLSDSDTGAVFFDFSDAFGSVNRTKLLYKISKDFGISGKLFLHLHDFLSNRHARLKVGDEVGAWLPSNVGTSAGTILGPILFILYVHDAPPDISKFADDFTAITTIRNSLHHNSTITIRGGT